MRQIIHFFPTISPLCTPFSMAHFSCTDEAIAPAPAGDLLSPCADQIIVPYIEKYKYVICMPVYSNPTVKYVRFLLLHKIRTNIFHSCNLNSALPSFEYFTTLVRTYLELGFFAI